jgi:phosphate:Na+ symporter
MTLRSTALARRVTTGNLVMRTMVALACLIAWPWADWLVQHAGPSPERAIANLHTGFNLLLAALFLPLVDRVAVACEKLVPAPEPAESDERPRYLDANALDEPAEALACAARETLRIGDVVQDMLSRSITVFRGNDEKLAREIGNLDDQVDRLHEAVKLYLMQVSREALDPEESRRYVEVLTMNTNLEHIGDIVDRNLMEIAIKKIRAQARFSEEGMKDITAFHARVVDNLKLALNVFMSGDRALARRLLQEKSAAREAEQHAAEKHLERLRAGRPETIDSSSIHLDVIRDLKRINSHITSVAYAILESYDPPPDTGRWAEDGAQRESAERVVDAPADRDETGPGNP